MVMEGGRIQEGQNAQRRTEMNVAMNILSSMNIGYRFVNVV